MPGRGSSRWSGVARLLPLADPERFGQPAPQPPADLGERIAATIGGERAAAPAAAAPALRLRPSAAPTAAVAAAVLAIVVLAGGGEQRRPSSTSSSPRCRPGVKIDATLEPHAYGTEIHMYVKGVRSGTLCRVFLRGAARRTRLRPAPSATAGATTRTPC